jgi:Bacterial archaeo-eukaryotic release factor family 3
MPPAQGESQMITHERLKELAAVTGPCLTIFEPVRDKASETARAETRIRAAVQESDRVLAEGGFTPQFREDFLRPLFKIASNTDWTRRNGSIALFRAPGFAEVSFLPDLLQPRVYLANEFLILPLLAGLGRPRNFWVLALSLHDVHLFRGGEKGLEEVWLPEEIAHRWEAAPRPERESSNRSSSGQSGSVHFGRSSPQDSKSRRLHDFFRAIDRAVHPIAEHSDDPLVLAAVSRELAGYREINSYPGLVGEAIYGSPKALAKDRLHAQALELAKGHSKFTIEKVRRGLEDAASRRLLVTDAVAIHRAAATGRVRELFVPLETNGGEALANSLAVAAIRCSSTVIGVPPADLPGGMVAILRYSSEETQEAVCHS